MQLFLRNLAGATKTLQLDEGSTVRQLKLVVQCLEGVPAASQALIVGRKQLGCDEAKLSDCQLEDGATVRLTSFLRGGKPVKVKMMTDHLPCGTEVWIDIEEGTGMLDIKSKLQAATGVPVASQKVMLSGIGQLVMGDKRTNIGFSHCGTANSLYFALASQGAEQGAAAGGSGGKT